MTINILMPALSPTMTEGTLATWNVKEGDKVASGDVIAEIETDKATMEVEAVDEGVIGKILVDAGTEGVAVNTLIAVLLEDGEVANSITEVSAEGPVPTAAVHESLAVIPTQSSSSETVPAGPVPLPAEIPDDPEVPADAKMVSMTVREALRDAMAEEMRLDKDVFVMGEEVAEYQGAYKVTQGLLDEFGDRRVIDTPITEHGFTGMATGAALAGLKPILEFMTFNFAMQAIDHIINSAAKTLYMSGGQMRSQIVFRGPNGAASRVAAQHSQDYSSWYAHIPGLKVIAPYTAADAKGLLKAAIRDLNPIIFLENEILYGQAFDVPDVDDFVLPIGKARIARVGSDVTLVSFSRGMEYTLAAADILSEQGVSAEVIDLRTLRPLDIATVVASVQKTNRCVTVEEGWPTAGIGAEISARLMSDAFDYLDAPVLRVSGKDVPMPYAANLEKLALPTAMDVASAARAVCYRD